ncbi:MAG: hypothetical protein EOO15_08430, partial [Chitinophagaceae bacterium]
MKKLILSAISGFLLLAAQAQTRPTYVVNPGETINGILKPTDIFKYPEFAAGTVYFKNGAATNGKLNYSYLAGAVQFIDPKGDTLSLNDDDQIGLVTIGKDSFYYYKAYLQLIERVPDGGGLYQKEFLRVANIRKVGLY